MFSWETFWSDCLSAVFLLIYSKLEETASHAAGGYYGFILSGQEVEKTHFQDVWG